MRAVIELSIRVALNISVPLLIIRRDLAQLEERRRDRSWNEASLLSAVVVFGPLALLAHFVRSRRSTGGALLGLLWTALAIAITEAVLRATELLA